MRFVAVVPAAGLSSRMGSFKPLMDLNGKALICRTLNSLRAGGAEKICVVTGHRAEELEAAIAAPDVCFVRNPDYASTGMLESVQLGLKAIFPELSEGRRNTAEPTSYGAIFILPGDIPLVCPETMQALKSAAKGGAQIVRPSHNGRAGHPVLLSQKTAYELLSYTGPDGLRGFLKGHLPETIFVETDDSAIHADADTPEECCRLSGLRNTAQ
ncbi:MAG: nucleotidyltransferase family protein [Firmicutes bacterium]|nr:nucleotidyltransferase family protein [Bacillota bacterium]